MNSLQTILKYSSWEEFNKFLNHLTHTNKKKTAGDLFENFVKLYLETNITYKSTLKKVYLLSEIDHSLKEELNLPDKDEGIDLVALTNDNKYWAIQAKYRSDTSSVLTISGKSSLASFNNLVFGYCKNFSYALVATTVNNPPKKSYLLNDNIGYLTSEAWISLDENKNFGWNLIKIPEKKISEIYKKEDPRPHQIIAVEKAINFYKTSNRGKLFMPCGTGKTLVSSLIARKLNSKEIIIALPSIALISQTLKHWVTEYLAEDIKTKWLVVCSDKTVSDDRNQDSFKSFVHDLGIPTTTDTKEIVEFLNTSFDGAKIIFTTYHSTYNLAKASKIKNHKFDLAILDEAHKTVGLKNKIKATLIDESKINIKKRFFMTATERVFRSGNDDFLSMDSDKDYGKIIHSLSFKQAIQQNKPIISDYQVLTFDVSDNVSKEKIISNKYLKINKDLHNISARELAIAIGLRKAIKKLKIKNTISFHRSIERAKKFKENQDLLNTILGKYEKIETFHVHGGMKMNNRLAQIRNFKNKKGLITNARCLTEGVDIPAVDCVCFVDPKRSVIDIVQAAGRAMRLSEGKKFGYILIPLFSKKNDKNEEVIDSKSFQEVINVIGHLSSNDNRISENLRIINEDKIPSSGSPIDGLVSLNMMERINLEKFNKSIQLKIWDSIAKFNYRSFEDVKKFVQPLKLESGKDWAHYVKKFRYNSKKLPPDIPSQPQTFYSEEFKGWGDFLNFFTRNPKLNKKIIFPDFNDAKQWARSKGIKHQADFKKFTNKYYYNFDEFPKQYTNLPDVVYKKQGWKSWEDFLNYKAVPGYDYRSSLYKTFSEARAWVQRLGLQSHSEWKKYYQENKLPDDIPKFPNKAYKDKGWVDSADYFGYKPLKRRRLIKSKAFSYEVSRIFAKSLKLDNEYQWNLFVNKNSSNINLFPPEIPTNPDEFYKDNGWISWDHFLGKISD